MSDFDKNANAGPLAGIKILDLSNVGPGARCARILADLGAEVTRVAPARKGGHRIDAPYHAYGASRGWRRIMLDLKQDQGRELFMSLAAKADVVIEGFRPGVAGRLKLGYEDVKAVNAKVVYCSISGYGQTGPAGSWVGHDINYDALAGMLATTDPRADGAPAIPGLTVADTAGGGMQAVISILAALLNRNVRGEGSYLDVSMTEGVLYLMSMHVDEFLATGKEPAAGTSMLTGGSACYDLYKSSDGRWISLGSLETGFFANVCKALGCEDLTPLQMDPQQQEKIRAAFRAAFATRTRDEWMAIFDKMDSCVAPVNTIAEVTRDPHFLARGAFVEVEHPEHGTFRQVGPLLAGMRRWSGPVQAPSSKSSDTATVLAEIGIDSERYQALAEAGIVS